MIIRGALGSGKSTIAEDLAKKLNAKHISYDKILDEYNLTEDKEEGMISRKSFFTANKIASLEAKKVIDKNPIIFDGNFYWKEQIEDLVNKLKYNHFIFTLKTDLNTCIKRDSKRKKSYGEDAVKAVYSAVNRFDYGIIIDNNGKANEAVNEIINFILN